MFNQKLRKTKKKKEKKEKKEQTKKGEAQRIINISLPDKRLDVISTKNTIMFYIILYSFFLFSFFENYRMLQEIFLYN